MYVDDRVIHLEHVIREVGEVRFIHFGHEVRDFLELMDALKKMR